MKRTNTSYISILIAVLMLCSIRAWGAPTSFMTSTTGVLGATDFTSADFAVGSKPFTIFDGDTYVFTFVNYNNNNSSDQHANWILEGTDGTGYFDLRADGDNWIYSTGFAVSYTGSKYTDFADVTTWNTAYNGVTVTLTVTRSGNVITATHTATTNNSTTYTGTLTATYSGSNNIQIYLSNCASYQDIKKVVYTPASGTAVTYPVYERGIVTPWSSSDVASSGSEVWIGNFWYNETYGLYASGTGNRTSVMTFPHEENTIQTFDIVFNTLTNYGDAGNYSYIKIGSDIEIQSNQQNQSGTVIINGASSSISNCNIKDKNRFNDVWTIHAVVNTDTKQVTELTITGLTMEGTTASYTLASATALSSSASFNTVTIGTVRKANSPSAALTSINIKETEQGDANYSLYYVYNSNTIKTVSGVGSNGNTIYAELPLTVNDQKYYAAGAATTSITLANTSRNTLSVNLRQAYTYTCYVNNIFGNVIANGTFNEEDVICWPKYVENNGTWYLCDESSYGVEASADLNKTVTYSTPTNIDYFFECEDMTASRKYGEWSSNRVYSNGGGVGVYAGATLTTTTMVSPGVYNISLYGVYRTNRISNFKLQYSVDGINWYDCVTAPVSGERATVSFSFAASTTELKTVEKAVIPVCNYIRLKETNNANAYHYLDYMTLSKVDETTTYLTNPGFEEAVTSTETINEQERQTIPGWGIIEDDYEKPGFIRTEITHFTNTSGVFTGTYCYKIWNEKELTNTSVEPNITYNYLTKSKIEQKPVNLPDGAYEFKIGAIVEKTGTNMQYAYMRNNQVQAYYDTSDQNYDYKTQISQAGVTEDLTVYGVVTDGTEEVKLGFNLNGSLELANSWGAVDNARLVYYGTHMYVEVTEAGWTTFSCPWPLDLARMYGGTAYIVTGANASSATVTLAECQSQVPANTGLIIQREGSGRVAIPVIASGKAPASNLLVATPTTTSVDVAAGNYVLGWDGTNLHTNGFYLVEAGSLPTLAARKAYLDIGGGSAKALHFVFGGDDITGVVAVENNEAQDVPESDVIYNLQGQVVNEYYKGIVIKNGRKYWQK